MQINKQNIKAFIEGTVRQQAIKLEQLLPDTIKLFDEGAKEQFAYRASICKPCLDNESCLVCGCKTPGLFFANKGCPAGKYPTLLNDKEWELMKQGERKEEWYQTFNCTECNNLQSLPHTICFNCDHMNDMNKIKEQIANRIKNG